MRKLSIQKLVLAAMFFATGIVLPFITGQVPQIGRMLLPMHLPVFLCSLIVGWQYGLAVGFLLPLVRSLLFIMPNLYPDAVAMAFELAAYGFFAGFINEKLHATNLNKHVSLFAALIASMLIGRVVWGIVSFILMEIAGNEAFTLEMFIAGAFVNALPGIIMQIVLIPTIMLGANRPQISAEPTHRNY